MHDTYIMFSIIFACSIVTFIIGFFYGYVHVYNKIRKYVGEDKSLFQIIKDELKKH